MLFSFSDFVEFNNYWRQKYNKPNQSKVLLGFYYPFALIVFLLTAGLFILFVTSLAGSVKRSNNRSNYKKVIKEGLLWDTTYYIEK